MSQQSTDETEQKRKYLFTEQVISHLGVTYSKRPVVEDGYDYVEPTLCNTAHLVFENAKGAKIYIAPKSTVQLNNLKELEKANIVAIVNCTKRVPSYHRPRFAYCQIPVNDEDGADILTYLEGATEFMHYFMSNAKGSLVVHCEQGISRSATTAMAYLIRFHEISRNEAYVEIKKRRPIINPNEGFWKQLEIFQSRFMNSTRQEEVVAASTSGDINYNGIETLESNKWASKSNALFCTCSDLPGNILRSHQYFRQLLSVQKKHDVISVCLDYVWGRGLLEPDLAWLIFVCNQLYSSVSCEETISVHDNVRDVLFDENSDFVQMWCGEIYEDQIQKVLNYIKK